MHHDIISRTKRKTDHIKKKKENRFINHLEKLHKIGEAKRRISERVKNINGGAIKTCLRKRSSACFRKRFQSNW